MTDADDHIRVGTDDDLSTLIVLLRDTMGWEDDERSTAFFEWKHHQNPFGPSPVWVGLDDDGEVIALRTFLRWEFTGPSRTLRAVRAVDTATHPGQQGKGWFRRLTLHAIEELKADGVDFIFNTPNDKSWPGYEKMGWQSRGKLTLAIRPRPRSIGRLRAARTAAEKWNEPTGHAPLAADVLPELGPRLDDRVESQPPRLHGTALSAELVRWRYGFRPLGYQVLSLDGDPAGGIAIYRVRQRGPARELTVTEVLLPDGAAPRARRLISAAMADSGADVAVTIPMENPWAWGMLPAPRLGPLLAVRTVSTEPPELVLGLGDVELF